MKDSSKRGAYKGMTDARRRAVKKFQSENADNVHLLLPRGKKQIIKDHATAAGESMNAYINSAIDARMRQQDADKTVPQENPLSASRKAADAEKKLAQRQNDGDDIDDSRQKEEC